MVEFQMLMQAGVTTWVIGLSFYTHPQCLPHCSCGTLSLKKLLFRGRGLVRDKGGNGKEGVPLEDTLRISCKNVRNLS